MPASDPGPVPPLIAVLDQLVRRGSEGCGVRELAEEIGVSRTTTHRLLNQLADEFWARQTQQERYQIGPRLTVLAQQFQLTHARLAQMPEALARIQARVGGTVFLSTESADGTHGQVAAVRPAPDLVRYQIQRGSRIPLTAGASGLAILSAKGPSSWAAQPAWPTFTPRTAPRADRLALLQAAKDHGFVVSVGQHIPDAAGVAAPLEVSPGVLGSISVSRPVWEFDPDSVVNVAASIKDSIADLPELTASAPSGGHSAATPLPQPATQVRRLDRLLTLLSTRFPLAAGSLAVDLGSGTRATKSILEDALATGIAHQGSGGSLWPGPRLFNWLTTADFEQPIEALAADIVNDLAADVIDTVGLSTVDADGVTTIRTTVPSSQTVQYVLETGVRLPPDRGAISKAILAYLPDLAARTNVRPEDLATIRQLGYAAAEGERIPQAFGIGSAFFKNGAVAGAVNVSIPRGRIDRTRVADIGKATHEAACKITRLLTTTLQ
jgi:DNA-binding IclR family transcriptional regulator